MSPQPRLPPEVDGIFIGGGHNTLVAASYLARAGARVLVLESEPGIGGGLNTEEATLPLFLHNLHVFFVRWTPRYRIWRDLRLADYGLETVVPEVQNAIPLREGGGLVSYRELGPSLEAISAFSPADARAYARLHEELAGLVRQVAEPLRFAPPLPEEELQALLGRSAPGRRYLELSRSSALELVRELFEDEVVRALVLFNVAVRGYLPVLDVPGTGHAVVLALPGSHTGAMVRGGTRQAARALAAGVFDHGGLVATRAPVARIRVEGGRAAGVELEDGRRFRARAFVASSLPASQTLIQLLEPGELDGGLRDALRDYRWNEEALFGVHLALAGPLRFGRGNGPAPLQWALNYNLGYESSHHLERDMRLVREGKLPDPLALHAGVPTLFDPGQAPPGLGTAFAWQFVPSRWEGRGAEAWDPAASESFAQRVVERWTEYAPNLPEVELARAVHSPLDTQRRVPSMVWGDRHHGSYHPANFGHNRPHPLLSGYRTPVEGLYLCGSSTYPGGSFTGQPGHNAATVIARDLGYELWWRPVDIRQHLESLG